MALDMQIMATLNLLLAAVLSMIIGLERQRRQHPAGLRTHMLVGLGSCLFTLVSIHGFPGSDTARIAAQIVTGIGFLGGGVILHGRTVTNGPDIKYLTTAAGIWMTAAIGMTVGVGAWFLASAGTFIAWIVLFMMRYLEPHGS